MSQVKIHTKMGDQKVEVVGGWDPPLKSYHFTVFDPDPPEDALTDSLWCNLDNFAIGEPKTLWPLKKAAELLGLELPEVFWELSEKKEGNVVYLVDASGNFTTR